MPTRAEKWTRVVWRRPHRSRLWLLTDGSTIGRTRQPLCGFAALRLATVSDTQRREESVMAINGRQYDWEDISVILPHGETVGITEIKYKDGQSVEARYGRGSVPRGYGRTNYEASGSFVLDRDEWEPFKMVLAASGSGKIFDHKPFPIVVCYANNDMGTVVDMLKDCKVTSFDGGGASQGDANASPITCEFTILSPIVWNGTPAK